VYGNRDLRDLYICDALSPGIRKGREPSQWKPSMSSTLLWRLGNRPDLQSTLMRAKPKHRRLDMKGVERGAVQAHAKTP
jgi:hypothetical protein